MVAPATPDATSFLGWDVVDLPMLVILPVLLVLSGFFSGSETALFSLSKAERLSFRDRHPLAYRAVDALLADQRMLLITILLGNMTVNVLYFVITSVLMMHTTVGPVAQSGLAVLFLLLIIITGEVGPKMIASAARERFAAVCGPLLLTVHRLIGPLRLAVSAAVVAPLSRLTAPATAPPNLSRGELRKLLDISEESGVIDEAEQRLLLDVLGLQRLKVRDVMTPRVNMIALPLGAGRAQVEAVVRDYRLRRVPIFNRNMDDIVGILNAKQFLLDDSIPSITDPRVLTTPEYVPDLVPLDRLLERFRRRQSPIAIVVNEYGGTEGVVATEDVVEEVVGDIVGPNEVAAAAPQLTGLGRWTVSGNLELRAFGEAFGVEFPTATAMTVGVLVSQLLGRPPAVGDCVEMDALSLEVGAVERGRVATVFIRLGPEARDAGSEAPE